MAVAHSYEKRWNLLVGGWSHYTDDTQEVLDRIAKGEVSFVAEGDAEFTYHPDGVIEIVRHTQRSFTPDEFVEAFG